jgi:glycine/D-amino acid oxidase-like deaminating enzyme
MQRIKEDRGHFRLGLETRSTVAASLIPAKGWCQVPVVVPDAPPLIGTAATVQRCFSAYRVRFHLGATPGGCFNRGVISSAAIAAMLTEWVRM